MTSNQYPTGSLDVQSHSCKENIFKKKKERKKIYSATNAIEFGTGFSPTQASTWECSAAETLIADYGDSKQRTQ